MHFSWHVNTELMTNWRIILCANSRYISVKTSLCKTIISLQRLILLFQNIDCCKTKLKGLWNTKFSLAYILYAKHAHNSTIFGRSFQVHFFESYIRAMFSLFWGTRSIYSHTSLLPTNRNTQNYACVRTRVGWVTLATTINDAEYIH